MSFALEWAQPLDARTKRHAVDYATDTARLALARGEAFIAVRIGWQLTFAQPKIRAHRDLLDEALAARDAASDIIARFGASPDPEHRHQAAAAHLALGQFAAAASGWLELARADPSRADAFLNFAWCMARAGNADNAAHIAGRIAATARHPKIDAVLAMAAMARGDWEALRGHARDALAQGGEALAWLPMAPVFRRAGKATEAAVALGRRLELLAGTIHLYDIARAIKEGRHGEAVADADRILAVVPDDEWAVMMKIVALLKDDDKVGAVKTQAAFAKAIGGRLDVLTRLLDLLCDIHAYQEVVDLGKAIMGQLPPDHGLPFGVAHAAAQIADIDTVDAILQTMPRTLSPSQKAQLTPFMALTFFDDPKVQKEAAMRRAALFAPPEEPCPVRLPPAPRGERIRIGYLSSDYHNHATLKLLTEVLELTDRSRFELIAYSYDAKPGDRDRERLVAAVDRFVDVTELGDAEIAERARRDCVHIMVDLKGYTGDARPGVLRHRLAPIQVNWLGYPGTYGMPEVDYVIADRFIVPDGAQGAYTEKVVRLPDCYQPNGRTREVAPPPSRAEAGLPADGFVFASFNQAYKINSALFAAWTEILKAVPGSVLWLLAKDEAVAGRLRARAAAHGLAPERLVFALPLPHAAHLARYGLVDLALDTYPVGSHTTASDALSVGAPLLALTGRSFVSRVSGSILTAAGLPHLVTGAFDEYVAKAVALGNDPATAHALRAQLLRTRETVPLFDAPRFAAHLAAAYETMVSIWRQGRKPEAFDVPPLAAGQPARLSA